jgi:MoxR-like ATPase
MKNDNAAKLHTAIAKQTTPHNKILAIRKELQERVMERDEVIDGAFLGMLSGHNVFLLGTPGTAKTYMVKLLAKAITGSNYFYYQVRKDSKFEEIYGALKMSRMPDDHFEYNPENHLPTAEFPFLDEIFKAGSTVLNSLLTALNEHVWTNDGKELPIPLTTCFSASNELPEDKSLNALWDRFMLRYEVKSIREESNFRKMLADKIQRRHSGVKNDVPLTNTITLNELKTAQSEVAQVDCSKVEDIEAGLWQKFSEAGLEFSDRTWNCIIEILQASAWLAGRTSVEFEDVQVLTAVFWDRPEQRQEVCRIITEFANPDDKAALAILDEAQSVANSAIKTASELQAKGQKAYQAGGEAKDKIRELQERLDRLVPSKKRDEVIAQVKSILRNVLAKCLGVH